ncbi:hypothetical protein BLNAU_22657 [Blattamonas nauphoetae]|uniref:Uncharacterized protein n=1 Tax=Blattamonas nauphoetae TaxID=2049346 RepID=A0ABQ9WSF2_9EUKA|nr:hypothetical protein BLNAU_22657 [Blattamonas nauphoetae]
MDGQDVDVTRCPFTHTTSSTNPSAVHFAAQPRTPKSTRAPSSIAVEPQAGKVLSGGFGTVVLFDSSSSTVSDCVFSQPDCTERGSPLSVVDAQSPTQKG